MGNWGSDRHPALLRVGATPGRARYPSSSGPAVDDAARATTTPSASVASVTDDRRHAVVRIKELAADKAALAAVGRLLDSFFHNVVDRCRVCATHRAVQSGEGKSLAGCAECTRPALNLRRDDQLLNPSFGERGEYRFQPANGQATAGRRGQDAESCLVVAPLHIRLDRRHGRLNVFEWGGHAHGKETDNRGGVPSGKNPLEPLRFRRRASEN